MRHYQSPSAIRRVGHRRLATFLKNRSVKGAEDIAQKAITAAKAQSVSLPAENVAATICSELAQETLALKESIDNLDRELRRRFFARPEARILASLPGIGPILGAEFLVSVGDLSASRAPTARRLRRPGSGRLRLRKEGGQPQKDAWGQQGTQEGLLPVGVCQLALFAHSRAFYDRKRAEGKKHTQALIALARRRVNVLWAMLRDGTTFEARPAA